MIKDEYYDFKLELKIDQNQVFVRCPKEGIDFGKPVPNFTQIIDPISSSNLVELEKIGDEIFKNAFAG